ncbi:MAG: glycosyltransferase, partial [Phycisphaerae bacterium]
LDINTAALTLVPSGADPGQFALTTSALAIPYVACFLDPVTATMGEMTWGQRWLLLESDTWIKWVWERGHAEELLKLGVPNMITMPMAAANDDFNTEPLGEPESACAAAFMGHPATTWFQSEQQVLPKDLLAGLTAAAVHADMPDLPFHQIYYDLHAMATPPEKSESFKERATKAVDYYQKKFVYNAYLGVKQRDRFVRFLSNKLGDAFELIGDHWDTVYGLDHTPRIWNMGELHERMRKVPICLNLMKGNLETGLNIRHFEITAYGGFMLTYETPELSDCFEIGKECAVFHNEAELLDSIGYYLDHPDERREIAAAGQRRTLRDHLYSHRIRSLVALLRKADVLPGAVAPQAEAVGVTG